VGEDLWSARGLWYFESDYWVRGRVLDLAAYQQATKIQQAQVVRKLAALFEKRERRRLKQDIDMSDIEQILSLPAWRKRYELYSAWIFTLFLKALGGHVIELEHENGRISFSFRETLMARVLSAVPPVAIYSERRVPLSNPSGHGRLAGAQPDYSFWSTEDRCRLAVECKHYKRSAVRNFADALDDYSSALGSARVVLANYGPVSAAVLEAIKEDRRDRCSAIGNVNPSVPKSLASICGIVRDVIGEPRPLPSLPDIKRIFGTAKKKLLVVDISGSMQIPMAHTAVLDSLRILISMTHVTEIAVVDDALVAKGPVHELTEILSKRGSSNTALGPVVQELLGAYATIIVLTDSDGAESLSPLRAKRFAGFPFSRTSVDLQLLAVRK
jgi:hypothetical protein